MFRARDRAFHHLPIGQRVEPIAALISIQHLHFEHMETDSGRHRLSIGNRMTQAAS